VDYGGAITELPPGSNVFEMIANRFVRITREHQFARLADQHTSSSTRNLGMVEMGGDRPTVHSAIYVDERANPAQQIAEIRHRAENFRPKA